MRRRITAILIVLCLILGAAPAAFAAEPTLENSVDMDQLVAHATSMFKKLEAGDKYDSVVNTSVGSVGMGIMGWIGSSALQLLKWCASTEKGGDPDYCLEVLGEDLYNEVVNAPVAIPSTLMPKWTYWKYRTFTSTEIANTKILLGSPVGINAQNALARCYIETQASHGWNAGVRTEAALIYYCSAENHYGEGGVKSFMTAVRTALGKSSTDTINSLYEFHQGAVKAKVSTLSYRTKVYNYLTVTLGLNPYGDEGNPPPEPDPTPEPDPDPEPTPEPCPSAQFTDVPAPGHWAHEGIDYVVYHGLFNGTSDTTFSPDGHMTRAMLVTVLYRLAGQPAVSGKSAFTDIPSGAYYEKAVTWAAKNAIVNGTSDTTFSPDVVVTREVLATVLFRYAQYAGTAGSLKSQTLTGFRDVDMVHDYAYYAMIWAIEQGIIQGDDNNCLNPCSEATRAQVAVVLMRFCTR